ncbi:MAG: hypothetical protein ACLPZM_02475 [Thermoplasmata archaeon]
MTRKFARLRPSVSPTAVDEFTVPPAGMCLSAFLVLTDPADPSSVLLGHIAPDPRWGELGGIGPERVARFTNLWMLPSSQLMLLEGPGEAARRLGRELLGLELDGLSDPRVFSESYPGREGGANGLHWDLHFVFVARGPARPPHLPIWRELAYRRVASIPRAEFARNQGDVLELVGLAPKD